MNAETVTPEYFLTEAFLSTRIVKLGRVSAGPQRLNSCVYVPLSWFSVNFSAPPNAAWVNTQAPSGRNIKLNEPSTVIPRRSLEIAVFDARREPSSPFSTLSAILSLVISTICFASIGVLKLSSFPIFKDAPVPSFMFYRA